MGRTSAAVVCAIVCVGVTGAASSTSRAHAPRPALRLLTTHPVRVRGAHFRAGEAVRLTARGGDGPRRAATRTDRRGGFRATIEDVATGCSTLTVTAVGASGDRAVARLPRLAC
jgi:hypothetical protein